MADVSSMHIGINFQVLSKHHKAFLPSKPAKVQIGNLTQILVFTIYNQKIIFICELNHILPISKEKKNMIFGQNIEISAIVRESMKAFLFKTNFICGSSLVIRHIGYLASM